MTEIAQSNKPTEEKTTNHNKGWVWALTLSAIMLFLPIYLIWFVQTPIWHVFKLFLQGLPITLFLFIPAFLFPKCSKFWAILITVLCMPAIIFSGMHVYYFNTTISEQSLFAIFESNMSESKEFLNSQITFGSVLCFLFLILTPVYFLVRFLKREVKPCKYAKIWGTILLISAIWLFGFSKNPYRNLGENTISKLYYSYQNYRIKVAEIKSYMEKMKNATAPNVKNENDNPITLLVVIGESSNRNHWGLYNYFRDTTPELKSIENELLVFKNVISPWARTTLCVSDAVTCKNIPNTGDVPMMNIFKQAGFATTWISLQSTVDEENAIVCLVSGADRCVYLNRGGEQGYSRVHDGKAMPTLREVLSKEPKNKKRIIFIHTMGSHVNYASRFPSEYAKFNNEDEIKDQPWFVSRSKKYINDYDNSICYTDHILCEYINAIRNEPNSVMLYFSDHGEECFDSRNQHGHHDSFESKFYFEIPYIIWMSENYKKSLPEETLNRWKEATNIPFVNYAAYTILQLAGVTLDCNNLNKTPLSPDYKAGPRIIHEQDFDKYFYSKDLK